MPAGSDPNRSTTASPSSSTSSSVAANLNSRRVTPEEKVTFAGTPE